MAGYYSWTCAGTVGAKKDWIRPGKLSMGGVDAMNEMLATVKQHFLPYFLHVVKVGGLVFVMGSSVNWENVNTSYLGASRRRVSYMFTSRLGVWVTMGHPWPGKLMSFAKAKRENKKIEARQEKRDLEDKYKALEATCTSTAIGKHWVARHVPTHRKVTLWWTNIAIENCHL